MTITSRDLLVREAAPQLLESCKELREALAGAMRVIAAHACADGQMLTEDFVTEIARLHISPGIGVRADDVIARAEGRPRRPVEPEPEGLDGSHADR